MRKPGLALMVTDLGIPGYALRTGATATDKGQGHARTGLPVFDVAPHGLNDPGKFMPRHMGQILNVRIMSLPGMPVTAANTTGLDPDYGAVRFR